MTVFEPLVNLFVLLTVLSIAAERVTNILKLRSRQLRTRTDDEQAEQARTRAIQWRALIVGALVAIVLKADIFSILARLEDPWSTLGWVRVSGTQWYQSPAAGSAGTILYAVTGSVVTGIALGFVSKFWHDVLDTVYELRSIIRSRASGHPRASGVGGQAGEPEPGDGGDG